MFWPWDAYGMTGSRRYHLNMTLHCKAKYVYRGPRQTCWWKIWVPLSCAWSNIVYPHIEIEDVPSSGNGLRMPWILWCLFGDITNLGMATCFFFLCLANMGCVLAKFLSTRWRQMTHTKKNSQSLREFIDGNFMTGWWFGCHGFYLPRYIGFLIIPIDFHIFQRGSNHQPGW